MIQNRPLMKAACEDDVVVPRITQAKNETVLKRLVADWHLGPDKASPHPKDNLAYWQTMARVWIVSEDAARRRLCANCEYFDNRPAAMQAMDSVPFNRFDMDGGGRGFCHKFDFICHNLRTCQAWEERDYELPDGGRE